MTTDNRTGTALKKQAITITRVFDAPRALVWKAWTDPEHYKRWWGPKDFTSPHCTIDLRVGGKYLSCMRGPDGQEYWNAGVYREIVEPERLVYTNTFADRDGNLVPPSHYGMEGELIDEGLMTITLEERDGKTTMTLRHEFVTSDEMREGANAGWNESLDKLAASLR